MLETLMDKEMGAKVRVIEQTENFCVVCPFASRFAFQVWIVPRKQTSDFSQCSQEMRDELAGLCKKMTLRMESVLDNPSYNLLLHLDPFQRSSEEVSEHSHWYVEIFPRLTRAAGFEWGTDVWVNPVSPESAAEQLRSI